MFLKLSKKAKLLLNPFTYSSFTTVYPPKLKKFYDIDEPNIVKHSREIMKNLDGKLILEITDYIGTGVIEYEFPNKSKAEIFISEPWDFIISATEEDLFNKIIAKIDENIASNPKKKKK